MSFYKQKLLQNAAHKLSKRLVVWHTLRYRMTMLVTIAIAGMVLSLQSMPTQAQAHLQDTDSKKGGTSHTQRKPATVTSVVAVPKVSVPQVAALSSTSLPVAATKTVTQAVASSPQPVVVPSPASSVSGLTPTAPVVTPTSQQAPDPQPTSPQTTATSYTSTNWSGYLATSGSFTAISGSWNVPTVTGNDTSTSADSTWIGIGGVTTSDLIQIGTQDIVTASGQISTSAFYEILPASSQPISTITVSLGDSMSASIAETASGQWVLNIVDNTNKESNTTSLAYVSSLSSAEWIEEDPSYSFRRQIPFDNFHGISFTDGSTMENNTTLSIAGSSAQPVTMVNNADQTIAAPSAIGSDGASFSVSP
jgi:hypothetical protein